MVPIIILYGERKKTFAQEAAEANRADRISAHSRRAGKKSSEKNAGKPIMNRRYPK
jgi:hypothetical protein